MLFMYLNEKLDCYSMKKVDVTEFTYKPSELPATYAPLKGGGFFLDNVKNDAEGRFPHRCKKSATFNEALSSFPQ